MRHLYHAFFVILLLSSCTNKSKKNNFPNAGVISYIIEYPNEISSLPTGSLMPKEMKFSFRKQQLKINIKGSLNVFSLNFISPSPNDSCITIFRFFNSNLISTNSTNEKIFFFNRNAKPKIAYLNDQTKIIAGFNCKKAVVSFKGFEPLYIYYTSEIDLQNPNRFSTLTEVEGVLMEFFVDFNGIRFHFTANHFDNSRPPRSEFKIPKDTKQSSQKEIEALITTLINNFR